MHASYPPQSKNVFSGRLLWGMVALLLYALSAQILLQGFSQAGETPRAALERLVGVDIAPTSCTMSEKAIHPHRHNHHHGESCALCTFFSHVLLAVAVSLAALVCVQHVMPCQHIQAQSRAPPLPAFQHPPGRAPPVII